MWLWNIYNKVKRKIKPNHNVGLYLNLPKRIMVNGKVHKITEDCLSYNDLVKLAGYSYITGRYTIIAMIPPTPPVGTMGGQGGTMGTLGRGSSTYVRHGSSFEVIPID